MNFLLDTCVLSEIRKKDADPSVVRWINQTHEPRLFVSVITLSEIQKASRK